MTYDPNDPNYSTYSHPFQASADGQKTRTYKNEENMRRKIQKAANETGVTWWLWQHTSQLGLFQIGRINPEGKLSTVIAVDGQARSSCCKAEIEITKDYTDTHVFVAEDIETFEGGEAVIHYQFVRTYDGMDGENVTIKCRECEQAIRTDDKTDWMED